jgi:hypothetical protein
MSMRYQAGIILPGYNPLKVANAPTIGTATAGINSASVTFTAPSDVGGGAITSYSVIAIKTSDGSTSVATGASSPISVTGLAGTAYTFKVQANNAYGPSPLSAASNSVTPLAVGSALGGGFLAGQISTAGNGIADYNLIVGPLASAQSSLQWKLVNTGGDPTSVIDGPANSSTMNNATYPAAQFCEGLTVGGQTDWYMPAKNELEICYYNLKPSTTSNSTSYGINANAVPARASNYTAGNPAQTSATAFQSGGTEEFTAGFYWSSTEFNSTSGWIENFNSGVQGGFRYKDYSLNVRAVRRVAV